MEKDFQRVLDQLKASYEKTKELLQTKKRQKIKLEEEIGKLEEEIEKLKYEISILKKPQQKEKTILMKNNLLKDIIYLIITLILPFIAVPSLVYILSTNIGWALLISKVLAIISTIFIPGLIIYSSLTVAKNYRKTVNDIMNAEEIIKTQSIEKSQDILEEKISQRKLKSEELIQVEKFIAALKQDITSYAISYNTIVNKFFEIPQPELPLNEEKEKILSRHKD